MDASLWIPAALLALACAAFIFWPQRRTAPPVEKSRLDYLRERRDVIYENIRDLNFEFRAGKYPEDDYLRQRESLENEAAGVLTEMDSLNA
jgi:hypothetical protein